MLFWSTHLILVNTCPCLRWPQRLAFRAISMVSFHQRLRRFYHRSSSTECVSKLLPSVDIAASSKGGRSFQSSVQNPLFSQESDVLLQELSHRSVYFLLVQPKCLLRIISVAGTQKIIKWKCLTIIIALLTARYQIALFPDFWQTILYLTDISSCHVNLKSTIYDYAFSPC